MALFGPVAQEYMGVRLVDIPSGMGGTLPAAVARVDVENGEYQVICLHHEFFPDHMLSAKISECHEMSYKLTPAMKAMIARRHPRHNKWVEVA